MHRRRPPANFWLGLGLIAALEALLAYDVHTTPRGPLHTDPAIRAILSHPPAAPLGPLARWAAVNFTALIWPAYLLLLDGLLVLQTGSSPPRRRPRHFTALCLASIPIWCLFDWVNFSFIHAWDYIGLPPSLVNRLWGYALAFASITPAMLLSGQVLMNFHLFDWARGRPWRMPRWLPWLSLAAGLAMFLWPLLSRDPASNLTLWASLVFLLDPLNYWLGRPSMWRDWSAGRYARTLACFAGGLTCGLLWEFWNYYALAKWTYHLPFLGPLEHYKYFEMPLPGLLGFLPFGLECWVVWQFLRAPLDRWLEPLPDDRSLL
jgi:hypothetical protein